MLSGAGHGASSTAALRELPSFALAALRGPSNCSPCHLRRYDTSRCPRVGVVAVVVVVVDVNVDALGLATVLVIVVLVIVRVIVASLLTLSDSFRHCFHDFGSSWV